MSDLVAFDRKRVAFYTGRARSMRRAAMWGTVLDVDFDEWTSSEITVLSSDPFTRAGLAHEVEPEPPAGVASSVLKTRAKSTWASNRARQARWEREEEEAALGLRRAASVHKVSPAPLVPFGSSPPQPAQDTGAVDHPSVEPERRMMGLLSLVADLWVTVKRRELRAIYMHPADVELVREHGRAYAGVQCLLRPDRSRQLGDVVLEEVLTNRDLLLLDKNRKCP